MKFFWKRTKEYGISPDRDDWVTPEETLVDTASNLSNIEIPINESIWRFAYSIVIIAILIVIGGVVWLSVFRHDDLAQLAFRNKTINVSVPPPRGVIMDRNGTPLVQNVPSFDLLVISRQVQRNPNNTLVDIELIARALDRDPEELTLFVNDKVRSNAVFFLAADLTKDQVLNFNNALPAGFYVITSTKRQYLDGPKFSHILGYVGKVGKDDVARDPYYLPSDMTGRSGIEYTYEGILRGTHGQLVFDSMQAAQNLSAVAGANLTLQIDIMVQKALWQSVWDVLREANLFAATAIAQDPQSGAVLALVNFPTYDNNLFSSPLSQADVDQLFNSKQRPMFNRAIAGAYNPGSTIKPFIGMAALEERIMKPSQIVNNDCINISIPNARDPEHPYVFNNWRKDLGPFDLYRAIADSCNVYFFTVGGGHDSIRGLGAEKIDKYLKAGLADSLLKIDLPGEEHGFVPTPDWKWTTKREVWYQGDTYNISIGQGDLTVTPLWINTYISAIANGGTLWRPLVANRVVDVQNNTLQMYKPQSLGKLPFSSAVISEMQKAMRETVKSGTAKILKDIGVSAAAKTGTAEVIKGQKVNALLTVYAPADNPRIALTVLFEGSSQNQGYALRAARQFLGWYFSPNRQATPSVLVSPTPQVTASASATTLISPSALPED